MDPQDANCAAMAALPDSSELVAHLARTSRLTASEACRVIGDVLSFMSETPEQFIRRRHLALQAEGCSNEQIFARLSRELGEWRFRAASYSERQIRRVIYG